MKVKNRDSYTKNWTLLIWKRNKGHILSKVELKNKPEPDSKCCGGSRVVLGLSCSFTFLKGIKKVFLHNFFQTEKDPLTSASCGLEKKCYWWRSLRQKQQIGSFCLTTSSPQQICTCTEKKGSLHLRYFIFPCRNISDSSALNIGKIFPD